MDHDIPSDILEKRKHTHTFIGDYRRGERDTIRVIVLTAVMMIVEIAAGMFYGSMALLADGWHMGTHVAALGITVFAYRYARHYSNDPRYSFGTGKVSVLGGFASAIALAVIAIIMMAESIQRLLNPTAIKFNEALIVAVIGLLINLLSALILKERSHHPDSASEVHHHDHNLEAAYLHVLADALTSITAIIALLAGKYFGWVWMDPIMGIAGSVVITRWSYGLIHDTSLILMDSAVSLETFSCIRSAIESESDTFISDLHVWQLTPNHLSACISIVTRHSRSPDHYKKYLTNFDNLVHVTIEVNQEEKL